MAYKPFKVQVDTPRNPAEGERHDGFWEVVEYEHDDTDIALRFAASAVQPVLVKEVLHIVEVAFGASATIDVGDGSDEDHWIDQVDIAENTAGNVTSSLLAATAGPKAGRWYTSNGQIKVTVGGTHTAGRGRVLAYLIRL